MRGVGLVAWMVVGLLAGALARAAVGSPQRGCLFTLAVGVVGGLIGGALFTAAGQEGIDEFGIWSILVAFAGASVLLLGLRVLDRR